jgi:hypothetical protein
MQGILTEEEGSFLENNEELNCTGRSPSGRVSSWNTKGGSTIDLLFAWFGLVCFANKNKYCQLSNSWFQTSQTGGQRYSDTSPFSVPWFLSNFTGPSRSGRVPRELYWAFPFRKSSLRTVLGLPVQEEFLANCTGAFPFRKSSLRTVLGLPVQEGFLGTLFSYVTILGHFMFRIFWNHL